MASCRCGWCVRRTVRRWLANAVDAVGWVCQLPLQLLVAPVILLCWRE